MVHCHPWIGQVACTYAAWCSSEWVAGPCQKITQITEGRQQSVHQMSSAMGLNTGGVHMSSLWSIHSWCQHSSSRDTMPHDAQGGAGNWAKCKSVTLAAVTGESVKWSTHKGTVQWHDTSTNRTIVLQMLLINSFILLHMTVSKYMWCILDTSLLAHDCE